MSIHVTVAKAKPCFHACRHLNVSLLDNLRVPLKLIQERAGHALTASFTLDAHCGQPEWGRNVEAARLIGGEIERAASTLATGKDLSL